MRSSRSEQLRTLQERLLGAVLRSEPLPGAARAPVLPDLRFVLQGDSILLLAEELEGPMGLEGLPKPVRVLSREALYEEARRRGQVAYLRFLPAAFTEDEVDLGLEARITRGQEEEAALGLSGVRVKFRLTGRQWAAGEPGVYAL